MRLFKGSICNMIMSVCRKFSRGAKIKITLLFIDFNVFFSKVVLFYQIPWGVNLLLVPSVDFNEYKIIFVTSNG